MFQKTSIITYNPIKGYKFMMDLFEYKKYMDEREKFPMEYEKEFAYFISYYYTMVGSLQIFVETLVDEYEFESEKAEVTFEYFVTRLARKVRKVRSIRSMINPHIYVTEFTERNGEKCLIGKVNIFPMDGDKKKLISVYLGKANMLGDKNSEMVKSIARVKVIAKLEEIAKRIS